LTGSAIRWLDRPAPIAAVLERADVIVHHGSMLTTEEALVAGKPQIVAPLYLEHLLTARALTELGVAIVIRAPHDSDAIAGLVKLALTDELLAERARTVAEAHAWSSPPDPGLPEALLAAVLP
jgi:UDP:flavonoid glycosyltransferase YjiC (YdhE family)